MNINQLIQAMSNPQQTAMSMIQNDPNLQNNPMIQNAIKMAQSGNQKGLENLATNIAKSNGIDINNIMKLMH